MSDHAEPPLGEGELLLVLLNPDSTHREKQQAFALYEALVERQRGVMETRYSVSLPDLRRRLESQITRQLLRSQSS